jgi:D-xylose transport system permease protein
MSTATTSPSEKSISPVNQRFRVNFQTYGLLIALAVIWIFFFVVTHGVYLSPQNFSNLFRQMTITAILSVGMVLVIVALHIDLSVGRLADTVAWP